MHGQLWCYAFYLECESFWVKRPKGRTVLYLKEALFRVLYLIWPVNNWPVFWSDIYWSDNYRSDIYRAYPIYGELVRYLLVRYLLDSFISVLFVFIGAQRSMSGLKSLPMGAYFITHRPKNIVLVRYLLVR